jgi:hypothetical protein
MMDSVFQPFVRIKAENHPQGGLLVTIRLPVTA